ncbi:MAG: L-histidine N(alpha)-methyltransferase [Candidatus Entotheonellia bacterium]
MQKLVFISHSHKDEELATSLVTFLKSALDLTDVRVRCTSVPGYKLEFGKPISEQIRDDINTSLVMIALITQNSLSSKYVLLELGAWWGHDPKFIIPILAPGLKVSDLPDQLRPYRFIGIDTKDARSSVIGAIQQISAVLGADPTLGEQAQANLDRFVGTFNSWNPTPPPEAESSPVVPPPRELTSFGNVLKDVWRKWIVTCVGDIHVEKFKSLFTSIQDHRSIESVYAYWGIGPALKWKEACENKLYHMANNIERFPDSIEKYREYFKEGEFNYVSLGAGEGSKDIHVILKFFPGHEEDCTYFPVDSSLEMLRIAIDNVQGRFTDLYRNRIAIQGDFEDQNRLRDIVHFVDCVGGNKPILYGFIGNTISNIVKPKDFLTQISQIMRTNDLLLFEAQIVDRRIFPKEVLVDAARREYQSNAFRAFAQSALIQHTNLSINPNDRRSYCVDIDDDIDYFEKNYFESGDAVLTVNCYQINRTNRPIKIKVPPYPDEISFGPGDKIRLYKSRKWTEESLLSLARLHDFKVLTGFDKNGKELEHPPKPFFERNGNGTGFMTLLLRKQSE